ncbi:hypothetical protein KJ766_01970 [Patescibacteria group bacterium]|nr:hypothetical protein [Patescibacteria group bacterium]
MINKIAKTGFFTSFTSYFVFLLADFIRPGFVSFHFSVHIILIFVLFFAFIWMSGSVQNSKERFYIILPFLLALIVIVMQIDLYKSMFGGAIVLISLTLPFFIFTLLNKDQKKGTK